VHVFFCPGNNELRKHKYSDTQNCTNSVEKFYVILEICKNLGVNILPKEIHGITIIPLYSWYTPTFSSTWNGDYNYRKRWLDFRKCNWPVELGNTKDPDVIANFFLDLNKQYIKEYSGDVITFSHFLPHPDLLPPNILLKDKTLPLVVGHKALHQQLLKIKPVVHVYGHTHINGEKVIDGIRYVQHALGHPRERELWYRSFERKYEPKLIFKTVIEDDVVQ